MKQGWQPRPRNARPRVSESTRRCKAHAHVATRTRNLGFGPGRCPAPHAPQRPSRSAGASFSAAAVAPPTRRRSPHLPCGPRTRRAQPRTPVTLCSMIPSPPSPGSEIRAGAGNRSRAPAGASRSSVGPRGLPFSQARPDSESARAAGLPRVTEVSRGLASAPSLPPPPLSRKSQHEHFQLNVRSSNLCFISSL